MTPADILRMAKEAGYQHPDSVGSSEDFDYFDLYRFAALIEAHVKQEAALQGISDFGQYEDWLRQTEEKVKVAREDEREQCARIAGGLADSFDATKEAHERLSPEPFRPESFGFHMPTVLLVKCIVEAIRQRGKA